MAELKPLADLVVGDRFWLAYAQDVVRAAVSGPERRAEQLGTAIAWFWTVYSTAALVALSVAGARLPPLAVAAVALPSLLLMGAYWLASQVRRPIPVVFDPRVPDQIEAAHAQAAAQKARDLRWAEGATGLAAASVVLALGVALLGQRLPAADFEVQRDAADPARLLVRATMPAGAAVQLNVRPADASATAASAASADSGLSVLLRADRQGLLSASLAAGPAAQRVTATWADGPIERSASRLLDPQR